MIYLVLGFRGRYPLGRVADARSRPARSIFRRVMRRALTAEEKLEKIRDIVDRYFDSVGDGWELMNEIYEITDLNYGPDTVPQMIDKMRGD